MFYTLTGGVDLESVRHDGEFSVRLPWRSLAEDERAGAEEVSLGGGRDERGWKIQVQNFGSGIFEDTEMVYMYDHGVVRITDTPETVTFRSPYCVRELVCCVLGSEK